MTLILENRLDLLVVVPTRHGKLIVFMIPPMVTSQTIIVVVLLTILVSRHEVDASRIGLWYATYGMDTITLDDPPSILFILMECAAIPRFVELAHTLNHLQKLHCVVVDEAHLLLSVFKPIMKCMLPLWVVGCQLVTLIASLSHLKRLTLRLWCPPHSLSFGCQWCVRWLGMLLMKWLMWMMKSFDNSLNGIAMYLLRLTEPWSHTRVRDCKIQFTFFPWSWNDGINLKIMNFDYFSNPNKYIFCKEQQKFMLNYMDLSFQDC